MRGDRVKIQALGRTRRPAPPVLRGRRSLWRMLDYLAARAGRKRPACPEKDFASATRETGIVVLISDLMDKQGYQGRRYLLGRKWTST